MPAKPATEVVWDDNDTDTTAPTSGEQADGHTIGDTLSRQKRNWLFRYLAQWGRWLYQSVFRSDDIFDDQFVPSSNDPPATGAGLGPVAAADFSARVYVNGYAVGPVASSAYTYTASRDHYWDLDEDGLWTAVVVTNGAGEPAVTTNAVRCYKVVTDATDRTTVTSYVGTWTGVDQPLRLTGTTYHAEVGSPTHYLVHQHLDSSDAEIYPRIYRSDAGADYGGDTIEVAANAKFATTWSQDNAGTDSYLFQMGERGLSMAFKAAGSAAWADNFLAGGWHQFFRVRNSARCTLETDGAGAVALTTSADKLNVASVSLPGGGSLLVRVTFTDAMPNANYQVFHTMKTIGGGYSHPYNVRVSVQAKGSVDFLVVDASGTAVDPATVSCRFHVMVIS